jgi:hypothetical protein
MDRLDEGNDNVGPDSDANKPDFIIWPGDIDALAKVFNQLFVGNETSSGTYNSAPSFDEKKQKWRMQAETVNRAPSADLWTLHLTGKRYLGVIPIRDDDSVRNGSIDVDDYQGRYPDLVARIAELGLPLVVDRSKSGGLHLRLFVSEPVPAADMRLALAAMALELELPRSVEIFPKQNSLRQTAKGVGSWIGAPYFGRTFGILNRQVGLDAEGAELSPAEYLEKAYYTTVTKGMLETYVTQARRAGLGGEGRSPPPPPPGGETGTTEEEPPEDLLSLIRDGLDADGKAPEDRSKSFHYVVLRLRERGWSIESIVRLFERYPDGIADKYRERLDAEVRRSFNKARGPVGLDKLKLTVDDFFAYAPKQNYIFAAAGEFWPASAVDLRCPRIYMGKNAKGEKIYWDASFWLDKKKVVEQLTWAPGEPQVIAHRLVVQGGWMRRRGCHVFNLYLPPRRQPGDPRMAYRWLKHLLRLYGKDQSRHIIGFLAHRIQRPQEKINHGIVLGGSQGIGKDTLLETIKYGIGPWNFKDISPTILLGRFNGFVKSVILRISEARDLGEISRYDFYEHTKVYLASPPDTLLCDEKNIREHPIFNVCGVIITSNYKTGGIYLPADDRRHYVAWSDRKKEEFTKAYWETMWTWYEAGGIWHVVAYLAAYDLRKFSAKAPPPKTEAWWAIVTSSMAPEDAELADVLDKLGNPKVVTLKEIIGKAAPDLYEYLMDRKNRRLIPHRMESCGYVTVRNSASKQGLWQIKGVRQVIYAQSGLTPYEQMAEIKSRYKL